ncbi:MAG: helix-turn-helix domain-containing protein [Thermoplasmatales archaeon]
MIECNQKMICVDPAIPVIGLIGKKYTIMIIGVLGNEGNRKNFNEILSDIPFSSSTIISKRLKELRNAGIIERKDYKGTVNYSLTKFGIKLRRALIPLFKLMEKSENDGRFT